MESQDVDWVVFLFVCFSLEFFFFLPFLVNVFTYFSWVVWIKNHHLSQRKNDYILHWLGQSQKRPVLHEAIIQCRAFIWKMGSQLQSPFSELSRVEPAGSFTSESKFVNQLLRILISPNIGKHAVTCILIFPWKVFFSTSLTFPFKMKFNLKRWFTNFKLGLFIVTSRERGGMLLSILFHR